MTAFATLQRTVVRIAGILLLTLLGTVGTANAAPILLENFDDVSTLSGSGWALVNASTPVGTTGWFQGNAGVFGSESGAPDSYIAANFEGAGFGGTINEWLITPEVTLNDGDVLTFSARTENAAFGDQLAVRMSTAGASTALGDFSTLVMAYTALGDSGWTQYSFALSGLGGATSGRLAFQYFADDTSVNGDYIGIDSVAINPVAINPVPEPSTLTLFGFGLAAAVRSVRRRKSHQR